MSLIVLLFAIFAILSCDSGESIKLVIGFESHDFGNIALRSKGSIQLSIENVSKDMYTVENFRLSGANPADFTVLDSGSHMLMPDEIKQIAIEFEPSEAGSRSALLEFDSDATKEPFAVELMGYGQPTPEFALDKSSYDYGKVYVTFSKSFDFEIENNGTGDLEVTQMTISGPNASDFTITSGLAPVTVNSSFTHPTSYTHKFTIEYAPLAAGTSDATLEITHNAAGSPSSLTLVGLAEDPFSDLVVDLPSYSFYGVKPGKTGDQVFEIDSTGVLDLNISDIEIIAGTSTEFTIKEVSVDGTPVAVAPYACLVPIGKKCHITVTFTPTTDGEGKTSTLKITSDANTSPTDIPLEGSTKYPILINECDMGSNDYVELYNYSSSPVDISGWNIQCWYLRSGTNKECGNLTFLPQSVIPASSCVIVYETGDSGDFDIGKNIMWSNTDGGECILLDDNGEGVDYMWFNMTVPDHIPSNITWNGASIPSGAIYNHYRISKTNTFSAADWAQRSSPSPDRRSINPGQ